MFLLVLISNFYAWSFKLVSYFTHKRNWSYIGALDLASLLWDKCIWQLGFANDCSIFAVVCSCTDKKESIRRMNRRKISTWEAFPWSACLVLASKWHIYVHEIVLGSTDNLYGCENAWRVSYIYIYIYIYISIFC